MYQITVYIPESHCEPVKQAMFDAGAGRYENYEHCAWQVSGQGQFKPLDGSQPFLGQPGELKKVTEFRLEMVCEKVYLKQVIQAMQDAHPYEQPAWFVVEDVQTGNL